MSEIKALEKRLVETWKKHHSANIFFSRKVDSLGLDIVGVPGEPLSYNKFLHHFDLRSFRRLLKRIGDIKGRSALDIGCGTGRWSKIMHNMGVRVVGIDLSEELLKDNKIRMPEIDFKEMMASHLNFQDNTFDLVSSVTVLHIPYKVQKESIKEICRVLKIGGFALIIEGSKENEQIQYRYSFPNSTRGWLNNFQEHNCALIYHEKTLNPLLLNFYFNLRDKVLKCLRIAIDGSSGEPVDALDSSSIEKIMLYKTKGEKGKKLLFLRKIFRKVNILIVYLLTKISYAIEYLNIYIFRYYPTSNGVFLFKKVK